MKIRCNNCKDVVDGVVTPKLIPFVHEAQKTDKRIPKYNVMLKVTCPECMKYITFAKQTSGTVEEANRVGEDCLKRLANN